MKIIYQSIFDVGKPRFKCGSGAAAAVGAAGLGNLFGNIIAAKTQSDINASQIAYSREAATTAFERQNEQYEKYLSPEAQAKQLNDIGLNAASVLGKGAGVGGQMPNVNQAQVPDLKNPAQNYSQMLKDTMQAVSMYADAKKKDSEVGLVLEQMYGQQLSNYYQQTQNYLLETFGESKISAELNDLYASAFLKYATGAKEEAVHDLTKMQEKIASNEYKITTEQAANIAMMIQRSLALMLAQTNAANAGASASRSQVGLNNSMSGYYKNLSFNTEQIGKVLELDAENRIAVNTDMLEQLKAAIDKDTTLSKADKEKAYYEYNRLKSFNKLIDESGAQRRLHYTFDAFNEHFPIIGKLAGLAAIK